MACLWDIWALPQPLCPDLHIVNQIIFEKNHDLQMSEHWAPACFYQWEQTEPEDAPQLLPILLWHVQVVLLLLFHALWKDWQGSCAQGMKISSPPAVMGTLHPQSSPRPALPTRDGLSVQGGEAGQGCTIIPPPTWTEQPLQLWPPQSCWHLAHSPDVDAAAHRGLDFRRAWMD